MRTQRGLVSRSSRHSGSSSLGKESGSGTRNEVHLGPSSRGTYDRERRGVVAPRTRQMPPPGFLLPDRKIFNAEESLSGVVAPGWPDLLGSKVSSLALHKKKHKKISPGEVQSIAMSNAELDTQALNGAEALWQTTISPVYGDPLCLEDGFTDISIRFAQRGIRWIKMARPAGISAANRRCRSELRARVGYGRLKPADPAARVESHDDFDHAKAQYAETLSITIQERNAPSYRDNSDPLYYGSISDPLHLRYFEGVDLCRLLSTFRSSILTDVSILCFSFWILTF